jgi:hypothetical protein
MAVRFMKTMSRTIVSAWVLTVAVSCGLDLRGEASADPRAARPSSDEESGSVAPGSSDPASSGGGSSDGTLADRRPMPDGPTADSTTGPAVLVPEAAVGDGDAEATGTIVEAGPSHGIMNCPADSDAAPCDLSTNVCCTCPGCFAPYPTGCFPVLTGCVGVVFSGVYARLTCGDSTNCGPGWSCCAQFDVGGALTGSSCLPSCPTTGAAQLCTSSAPCGAGKSCRPVSSAPGFSTCQ